MRSLLTLVLSLSFFLAGGREIPQGAHCVSPRQAASKICLGDGDMEFFVGRSGYLSHNDELPFHGKKIKSKIFTEESGSEIEKSTGVKKIVGDSNYCIATSYSPAARYFCPALEEDQFIREPFLRLSSDRRISLHVIRI